MRLTRMLLPLAAAGALTLTGAGAAFAAGAPVVNETDHPVNASETFTDVDPCTGDPAQISITYSGVEHFMLQADGTGHFTDTERGTFVLVHVDALGNPVDGAYANGRFTMWDGGNGMFDENGNLVGKAEQTATLNGNGTRTDGSTFKFHNDSHITTDDIGDPKVAFFHAHCG